MRKSCSSIIATLILAMLACAQDTSVPIGFMNAVGLATKTDFQIDGKSIKPAGFSSGAYASSFGVAEGSRQLSFANGDCEKLSTPIAVTRGASPLYILYVAKTRQSDGKIKNTLKLTVIPPQKSLAGVHFLAFSTLEGRQTTLQVNGAQMSIEQLRVTPIAEGSLTVPDQRGQLVHTAPREAGNYAIVLFEGIDSQVRWSIVEMPR